MADPSANPTEVIPQLENAIQTLIPFLQDGLDLERDLQARKIAKVERGRAPEILLEAAQNVLLDPEASAADKQGAQDILDGRDTSQHAADFVNSFLLGENLDGSHGDVVRGWIDSTKGLERQLDGIHDLPDLAELDLEDGVLSFREQEAVQGVSFLLARSVGLNDLDNWRYTSGLGDRIRKRFDEMSFEDQEAFVLRDMGVNDTAAYEALGEEAQKVFIEGRFAELKTAADQFLGAADVASEGGILAGQRLYSHRDVTIPSLTIEIFDEMIAGRDAYTIDRGDGRVQEISAIEAMSTAEANVLNLFVYEFTQGMDVATITGKTYDGINPLDTTKTPEERFMEAYQQGVDLDDMYGMLEALPFGTEARRTEMKALFDRLKEAKEENPDVAVMVLASMFGAGIESMNVNLAAGSDYLFQNNRMVTVDPRLADFSIQSNGETIDAQAIFELHRDQVNNFQKPVPYEPMYFTDDAGNTYVAALDVETRVFQIEPLDLEAWRTIVERSRTPGDELARQDGEHERAHSIRLDQALRDVDGYDLIFQKLFERGQATFGGSFTEFPSLEFVQNIASYADVQVKVAGVVQERSMEELREAVIAATPGGEDALRERFSEASQPDSDAIIATSLDEYDPDQAGDGGAHIGPTVQNAVLIGYGASSQ